MVGRSWTGWYDGREGSGHIWSAVANEERHRFGIGRPRLVSQSAVAAASAGALHMVGAPSGWVPGDVLPVRPSTLRVWKRLQKSYPSTYPSEAVSDPSGPTRSEDLPGRGNAFGPLNR